MMNDEIVDEVRARREAHAAKFNYDLHAIYDDLKKSESEHITAEHPFIKPPASFSLPKSTPKRCFASLHPLSFASSNAQKTTHTVVI